MCLETGSSIFVLALAPGVAADGEKPVEAVPSPWEVGEAHTEGRGVPALGSWGSLQDTGQQGAAEHVCITHPLTATFVCSAGGESCPWAPWGPQLL